MKKNFGSAVVKKVITVAMATMLATLSPAISSVAVESNELPTAQEVVDGVVDSINGVDILNQEQKDFLTNMTVDLSQADYSQEPLDIINDTKEIIGNNISDAIAKDDTLSQDQKDLLTGITDDLKDTDITQSSVDLIDNTKEIIGDNVEDAIEKHVGDIDGDSDKVGSVVTAVSGTEQKVADATDLDKTIESYETVTDTLLNNDKELVASVAGNVDSDGNQIVETITSDGDIIINVTDDEGNTSEVKLDEYTQNKADEAITAADDAQAALNSFLTAPTTANAQEQQEKINAAIETAEAAKNDAETAYNAAESVLKEEIKKYNAYAAKYGKELYTYKGEVLTYTDEELANMSELASLDKDSDAINTGITDLNNTVMDDQLAEINAAAELVTTCDVVVEQAKKAVDVIETTEDSILKFLEKIKEDTASEIEAVKKELETASDSERSKLQERLDYYQQAYDNTEASLRIYTEEEFYTEVSADGTTVSTLQDRFDYAVNSAKSLAADIDTMVDDANAKLTDSTERYNVAKAAYDALKAEYEDYLANNIIDTNFKKLQDKLSAAEATVIAAQEDLNIAIEAVKTATEIKDKFEEEAAKIPTSNPDAGSSSSSSASSNVASGSAVNTATTPATTSITDGEVPLADTPAEFPVIIEDEGTPLVDSVPKTGDATTSAGAVGATGLLAILGALFVNLKKRTLR